MKSQKILVAAFSLSLSLCTLSALSTGNTPPESQDNSGNVVNKKSSFEKDVEIYLKQKNFKAYAMAFGEKSGWVSGYGYNFSSQEKADERALGECRKRKQAKGIDGLCKIRTRGDKAPQIPWGNSSYTGCDDPKYADYIAFRLTGFESHERQRYEEALKGLVETPYERLSDSKKFRFVRQNTVYSARFDTKEVALENIKRLNSGLMDSPYFFRKDGDIPHETNIAYGWLALKEGNVEQAIHFLLESTYTDGSPVLGSFGPDMSLIRELYKMGHKEAVLEYLKRSDEFWNTEPALEKKAMWRVMAKNNCPIQFQFYDTTNFSELGLQLD